MLISTALAPPSTLSSTASSLESPSPTPICRAPSSPCHPSSARRLPPQTVALLPAPFRTRLVTVTLPLSSAKLRPPLPTTASSSKIVLSWGSLPPRAISSPIPTTTVPPFPPPMMLPFLPTTMYPFLPTMVLPLQTATTGLIRPPSAGAASGAFSVDLGPVGGAAARRPACLPLMVPGSLLSLLYLSLTILLLLLPGLRAGLRFGLLGPPPTRMLGLLQLAGGVSRLPVMARHRARNHVRRLTLLFLVSSGSASVARHRSS
mmetsp:Transcript_13041/g.30859  ORF Transcript_13041/g.30859 Transcript_13041/m.30859 type:complete len:261 (+) Transcript_13041:209-991(+)